jgi:arabinofuranosyltransferase
VIALTVLAYWFYVGGDVFYERFLLVLVPLGIASMLELEIATLSRRMKTSIICLVLLLQLVPFAADKRFRYHVVKYDRWIELGEYLRTAHPNAVLATDAIGKIPFYSQLRTIDMLGLCDERISHSPAKSFNVGHSRYDPEYVISKAPTLIAAWVEKDLDLKWGLKRDLYRKAGYVPKYAVNTLALPRDSNILDVENEPEDRVMRLIETGYGYMVLLKVEPDPLRR